MPMGLLDPELWRQAKFGQTNAAYGQGGLLSSYLPKAPAPFKPTYNPVVGEDDEDGAGGATDPNNDPDKHGSDGDYPVYEDQPEYDSFGSWYDAANLKGLPGQLAGMGPMGIMRSLAQGAASSLRGTPTTVSDSWGGGFDGRDVANADRMARGDRPADPMDPGLGPQVGSSYIRDAAERYGIPGMRWMDSPGGGTWAPADFQQGGGPLSLSPEFTPRPTPNISPAPETPWGTAPLSLDFIGREPISPSAQPSHGTDGRGFLQQMTSPQALAGLGGGVIGGMLGAPLGPIGGMVGGYLGGHVGANLAPSSWRGNPPEGPSHPVPQVEVEQQMIGNDQEYDDYMAEQEAQGWAYDEDNDVWYRE